MRRTTVLLADELADQLDYERRRRNQSTAAIVREALTEYLAGGKPSPKRLGFVGLGRSGYRDTSVKIEEILAREWAGEKPAPARHRKGRTGKPRRDR
jgi:ribbon-helix-helix CopG family protein